MRVRVLPVLAVTGLLTLAGCGGSSSGGTSSSATASASVGGLSGTVTVFAAASLTDVFAELGDRLEQENPELTVQFNFAGSSALATQVTQGAPADVFASANEKQMTVVTDAGLADGEPTVFTENVLEIAVPAGNPAGVTGLAAGQYELVHRVNADHRLREQRYDNNAASVRFRLSWPGGRGERPRARVLEHCSGTRCAP